MPITRFNIPEHEIELTAVRAQGAGGQNVNKVSSAIHLRFDIARSSLPEPIKLRLAGLTDQRVTKDGMVIIKAQQHRTQERNREEALARLHELVERAAHVPKPRRATKPSRAAKERRLKAKSERSAIKTQRSTRPVE